MYEIIIIYGAFMCMCVSRINKLQREKFVFVFGLTLKLILVDLWCLDYDKNNLFKILNCRPSMPFQTCVRKSFANSARFAESIISVDWRCQ